MMLSKEHFYEFFKEHLHPALLQKRVQNHTRKYFKEFSKEN